MPKWAVVLVCCACATVASAQVGEFSVSGGVSRFGGASLLTTPHITIGDGFRLTLRFTLNTWRFLGHEFGYAYSRSHASIPQAQAVGLPIHQGFYDFLFYATPEGSRVRPFATGGIQFSSFFPPGTSVSFGNQVTKFGVNYGGGIKFRVTAIWGVRFDVRQYNTGKPDLFVTQQAPSGRLKQTEFSAGLSFNF